MKLFEPVSLRGLTLRNRLVISPMCQYSAIDGMANDYHLTHLGRFGLGGFGLVMVEATAVEPEGRITHGDLGLWSDDHIDGLARIVTTLKSAGAAAGIQLAHAGPKASVQRPWHGGGPLDVADFSRGEHPWPVVSAADQLYAQGWLKPTALSVEAMESLKEAFVMATQRAHIAGFDMVEVHCAHGYLLNSFLSPVTNTRNDEYGGDLERRMRFALEVVQAVRGAWPEGKPLFVRVSAVDGIREGVAIEDTIEFARRLKELGVDIVDCSSGGISRRYDYAFGYGYQVPYAQRVRNEAGIGSMAVGLIVDAQQAQEIVAEGQADLVALGREALADPNWALHAQAQLREVDPTRSFDSWPIQAGFFLKDRAMHVSRFPSPLKLAGR